MSNQNLNTLNVKTLNYTADYIYHRGTPIYLDGSGVGSLWSKGAGDNIYYDKGDSVDICGQLIIGTVSIGTAESSGNLYIAKQVYWNDYGPATFPPNLYLKAPLNNISSNSTAVLKFSASYIGTPVRPAYIWHEYGEYVDRRAGKLCITANDYTSFVLDGETGWVSIGNRGQSGTNVFLPTYPLDVSGNTLIRGDLQVGMNASRKKLILKCTATSGDISNNPNVKGLKIEDDAGDGLYTKLRTNTYITQLAMGITYDNSSSSMDIDDVLVLQARDLGSGVVGAVGIGTFYPTETLDVSGSTRLRGALYDSSGVVGAAGQVLTSTVTGTNWATAGGGGSHWTSDLSGIHNTTGHVGIGKVSSGVVALDVSGDALIHGLTVGKGTNAGLSNTAIGYQALYINTTAGTGFNTAIGYQALSSNTTGTSNVATGFQALKDNSGGKSNVATGSEAMKVNWVGSFNVATGSEALHDNNGGSYNVATGFQALKLNTDGSCNVATGYQALNSNIDGSGNVATGYRALYLNTGNYNVATGYHAMFVATTGNYNVATGYKALYKNTSGVHNVAVGSQALLNNTTGVYNVATGSDALQQNSSGGYNVATGLSALQDNTDGSYNVAIGHQALLSNTTGNYNTATGFQALFSNLTNGYNTATGSFALHSNTDGSLNVATGYAALNSNLTGIQNTAIGYEALYDNSGGDNNVAIGSQALLACTGGNNTAIGKGAGMSMVNGNDCVVIGHGAVASHTGPQNQIVIGSGAMGIGNNTVALGNTSISNIEGQVDFAAYSDSRIKKNITDSDLGLDFINKLRPIKYNKVNPADYPELLLENRYKGDNPDTRYEDDPLICDGLIAQEVEEVLKQLGKTWSGHSINDSNGKQSLAYGSLTVPLIKAVQELTAKLAAMEARLTAAGL